jgi:hypothetical protein
MSNATETTKSSFPVLAVLGIVFITLKLCHVIAWSWLWVLAPFWVIPALLIVIFLIGAIVIIAKGK